MTSLGLKRGLVALMVCISWLAAKRIDFAILFPSIGSALRILAVKEKSRLEAKTDELVEGR